MVEPALNEAVPAFASLPPDARAALADAADDVFVPEGESIASEGAYAYALFDLGRSLRLSGDPRAAVPVLYRRLQIPDQTETSNASLRPTGVPVTNYFLDNTDPTDPNAPAIPNRVADLFKTPVPPGAPAPPNPPIHSDNLGGALFVALGLGRLYLLRARR